MLTPKVHGGTSFRSSLDAQKRVPPRRFERSANPKRSLQALASPRYLALADPIVQWPRTPPFHGGKTGSNTGRVAPLHEGKRPISRFSFRTDKQAFKCVFSSQKLYK